MRDCIPQESNRGFIFPMGSSGVMQAPESTRLCLPSIVVKFCYPNYSEEILRPDYHRKTCQEITYFHASFLRMRKHFFVGEMSVQAEEEKSVLRWNTFSVIYGKPLLRSKAFSGRDGNQTF